MPTAQDITRLLAFDLNTLSYVGATADGHIYVRLQDGSLAPLFTDALEAVGVSVVAYGAAGDGTTDDTAAIQAALDTGSNVFFPAGTYKVTSELLIKTEGQVVRGSGKFSTIITNTTTSARLIGVGDESDNAGYARRVTISDLQLVGNAATTEGLALKGIIDDNAAWGDASKACTVERVRIRDVGAGYALRVSSWSNNLYDIEIWDCNKGLMCGAEMNACGFHGMYINNCTNECIVCPSSSGQPSTNSFTNIVAQNSGGTNATIDLQDGYAFAFDGLYLEGNQAPANVNVGGAAHGIMFRNVMHNLASGTSGMRVIKTSQKNIVIDGVINLGGTVDSLVEITGTLPLTVVGGLFVSSGTATNGLVSDLSTRKATVFLDGLTGRLGPTALRALTTQNAFEVRRSDTDAVQWFVRDGKTYYGATTAAPLIGSGSGTPEAAVTAPVGSLFLRTDGGAGTTLYVKESGAGNTGWVAK